MSEFLVRFYFCFSGNIPTWNSLSHFISTLLEEIFLLGISFSKEALSAPTWSLCTLHCSVTRLLSTLSPPGQEEPEQEQQEDGDDEDDAEHDVDGHAGGGDRGGAGGGDQVRAVQVANQHRLQEAETLAPVLVALQHQLQVDLGGLRGLQCVGFRTLAGCVRMETLQSARLCSEVEICALCQKVQDDSCCLPLCCGGGWTMVIVAVLMFDLLLLLLLVQLHLDRGLVQLVELVRQVDVLQDVLVHRDQLVRVVRLLPEHLQVFIFS